jgi:nucleotide-binding universal stress UspA family protein
MIDDRAIVVGVDGSPSSLEAVRWAAAEAARREVSLTLLHAFFVHSPEPYRPGTLPCSDGDALLDHGREWLSEARTVAEETADVPIRTDLRVGLPAEEMIRASRAAGLVVLGSRGLGGISGLLLGSVAVTLAAHGHCPVVVVRAKAPEDGPIMVGVDGPIVVGVDGSPLSDAAVVFAFEAAYARRAPLIAVRALSSAAQEGDMSARLSAWQAKYPEVEVSQRVVKDRPAHALLRAAEGVQLIAVGSRGPGGPPVGLGSTSQAVLHRASCSVAVIRQDAPDAARY